jgi:hypothetical protein
MFPARPRWFSDDLFPLGSVRFHRGQFFIFDAVFRIKALEHLKKLLRSAYLFFEEHLLKSCSKQNYPRKILSQIVQCVLCFAGRMHTGIHHTNLLIEALELSVLRPIPE